jgi:hypothetical protein
MDFLGMIVGRHSFQDVVEEEELLGGVPLLLFSLTHDCLRDQR